MEFDPGNVCCYGRAVLDADAARLLSTWAAASPGPVELQPVEALRSSGLVNEQVTGPPPEVWTVVDTTVETGLDDTGTGTEGGATVPVRIYRPSPGQLPVVVYAHGGGWTLLSIDAVDTLCRHLAIGARCAVISVGYRLAPEHPFPAAFEDVDAVTRWAAAGGLGWQPPRLAVAGDSAGGNLAAAVALAARDRGSPRIDLQLLLYPAIHPDVDTPSMQSLGSDPSFRLTPATMRWFWSNYLGDDLAAATDPRAVPGAAHDVRGVAPAMVVTPEFDPLKDDGRRWARRLGEAGVDVTLIEPAGLPHGFAMMLGVVPAARRALDGVIAETRRTMHPPLELAREFRRRPFGRHSEDLQKLLHQMRSQPIRGKHFLFISRTNEEWVLGRFSDDVPPVPDVDWSVRFDDLEEAEWHVFKLRWRDIFGEELGDE